MSLVRLALRAATIAALSTPPYPTLASALVFDSKMDPIEHTATETTLPCLLVYTDRDEVASIDRGDGRSFNAREITLIIECVIATFSGTDKPKFIETDAELEAMLDLFEWQVWRALYDPHATAARPFNALVKRFIEWKSEPGRSTDKANRYAVRQLQIKAEVRPDCLPGALVLAPGERAVIPEAPEQLITGLPNEPPYFKPLEEMLRSNPAFAPLLEQLREARTGMPSRMVPMLTTIGWRYRNVEPNGSASPDIVFTAR